MDISKDAQNKITQLQMIEQNLQHYLMQKQNFNAKLLEIGNALREIEESKDEVYKIVGNIMILANKDDLKKDLETQQEVFELRVRKIREQEESLKEKAEGLQKELVEELNLKKE